MIPVIDIENISKKYKFGVSEPYVTLREAISDVSKWSTSLLKHHDGTRLRKGEFWALKDVSFQVMPGEIFGVIGANGTGKSTLLKILSRITSPTAGQVILRGRVSSLLEVGTGFNPELTGRENIYLNGAILGMRQKEIKRKFDEIVNFAEVGRFLDTPVKHYSSGMYMRLAFAVAAHLEPEILLVDEVLAVGDAKFQKKSLGKMEKVASEGRTVVFVSHNMVMVRELCNRALMLKGGRIAAIGKTNDIISQYLLESVGTEKDGVILRPNRRSEIALTKTWFTNRLNRTTSKIDVSEPFKIWLEFTVNKPIADAEISIGLTNSRGVNVIFTSLSDATRKTMTFKRGKYTVSVLMKGNFLLPDSYLLSVFMHVRGIREIERHDNILKLTILESDSNMAHYGEAAAKLCCVLTDAKWDVTIQR